jgi:hypothetical protein
MVQLVGRLLAIQPKQSAASMRPEVESMAIDGGVMHPLAGEMRLPRLVPLRLRHFAPSESVQHTNADVTAFGSPEMFNSPLRTFAQSGGGCEATPQPLG